MSLVGKVALVTGAGSGIGRAIALALAGQGVAVVVNDVDLERAQKVAQEVAGQGVRAVALKADVAQPAEVAAMLQEALRELGRIDILVNNAGTGKVVPFTRMSYEEWRQMLAQTPVGRLGTPEDIAQAALFLASEAAGFITGQVLSPNGGYWV